jgi:hypothetical protein
MHILSILFVLVTLGFALYVIGGTLFAHSERIAEALSGHSAKSDCRVTFVTFGRNQTSASPAQSLSTQTAQSLPLAA